MISNNLGNCLITGSSGFVGSRLTDLLFKSGNKIKFISRSHSNNFDVEKCDFLTEDIPIGFFQGIDTVFHLAGLAHDTNNSSSKDDFIKINIDATRKLADIASRQSVKRFIFLSSVKASENLPNNLNVSRKGLYGYTKEKAEQELIKITQKSDMQINILRSCLVYGPDMKGNLKSMKNAINQGWFPKLTESKNKKSLIHVDDLAKALVFIAENYKECNPLNVTDGQTYSSEDIYKALFNKKSTTLSYRIPESLFKLGVHLPIFKERLKKIYGNDFFSAEQIFKLGFTPEFSLYDLDEKSF